MNPFTCMYHDEEEGKKEKSRAHSSTHRAANFSRKGRKNRLWFVDWPNNLLEFGGRSFFVESPRKRRNRNGAEKNIKIIMRSREISWFNDFMHAKPEPSQSGPGKLVSRNRNHEKLHNWSSSSQSISEGYEKGNLGCGSSVLKLDYEAIIIRYQGLAWSGTRKLKSQRAESCPKNTSLMNQKAAWLKRMASPHLRTKIKRKVKQKASWMKGARESLSAASGFCINTRWSINVEKVRLRNNHHWNGSRILMIKF